MKRKHPKIRLGYACINTYLRRRHIFTSRTARQETINKMNREFRSSGMKFAQELLKKNLQDLLTILQWNEKNRIRLFRVSSEIAPHITNPYFIPKSKRGNPKTLAYSLERI